MKHYSPKKNFSFKNSKKFVSNDSKTKNFAPLQFKKFSPKKSYSVKPQCILTVRRTNNNVFVVVSDQKYNISRTFSTGMFGFKNSKKDTPYAAECVGKCVGELLFTFNIFRIHLRFKSPLDNSIQAVLKGIFEFKPKSTQKRKIFKFRVKFFDCLAPAHNGCRQKRLRRV